MRAGRPYIGLEPFQESDAALFFGRERDIEIVVANLYASALTVLYGSSGAGKSSLLRAGVASRLRAEPDTAVVVFAEWDKADFDVRLKSSCRAAVEAATGRAFDVPAELALDDLLVAAGKEIGGPVLLLLDQFEDYLLHPPPSAGRFESEFARSINRNDVDAGFLIALREDWLSRLERFSLRIPNLLGNMVEIRYLDCERAEQAIRGPLAAYNGQCTPSEAVEIEEELVQEVLRQADAKQVSLAGAAAGADSATRGIAPPVLQLILTRVWDEERREGSRLLRLETLRRLGGAGEIARAHIANVMREMAVDDRRICARMFFFLVTPSGTKTPYQTADLAELSATSVEHARELLEQLTKPRIVARLEHPERYEVYHDVLAPAVLRWRIDFEKEEDRAEAERKAEDEWRRAEREAIAARRLRWLALALAALAASLAVMVVIVWSLERERQRAYAERMVAESLQESATGDPERAILEGLEAYDAFQPPELGVEHALYMAVLRSRVRATLAGHSGSVNALALASAANLIVTAGDDGTARVWDIGGKPLQTIQAGQGPLISVAVTRSGDRVATVGVDGSVRVWDQSSGQAIFTVPASERISAAALSPDGRTLATGSKDQVTLRDDRGDLLKTLVAPIGRINSVVFSADGTLLAATGENGSCEVWRVPSRTEVARLLPRDASGAIDAQPVRQIALSPDGGRLATATEDGAGRIYDVNSGKLLVTLSSDAAAIGSIGHGNIVQAIAFSPDGKRLITGSWDRTAVIWNAATGRPLITLRGHTDKITGVAFAGQSRVITGSADGTVRIWDSGAGLDEQTFSFQASDVPVYKLAYSPDGKRIATAAADGTAKTWDAHTGTAGLVLPHGDNAAEAVTSVAFSADGARMATTGTDARVRVWDASSGKPIGEPMTFPKEVMDAAFSPDGRQLAAAGWDPTIRIWNLGAGAAPRDLKGSPGGYTSVVFNSSGSMLAVSGLNHESELWDLTSGSDRVLTGHSDRVLAIAFSPGGDLIATASADSTAALWRARSATLLRKFTGHSTWVRSVAFSADGRRLLTAGRDGFLKLWDVASGNELLTIDARSGPLTSAAFDPAGTYFAAGGDDGWVRVYAVPPQVKGLVDLARSRATRRLTPEERRKFLRE